MKDKRPTPKLAIFDIDGTIAERGRISKQVLQGIQHLHQKGCLTTVSTGRGYVPLRASFGANFEHVVSPGALLILEHGTKVLDRDGKLIYGAFFDEATTDHVIDFIRRNQEIIKFAWYNPLDVTRKTQMWCPDASEVQIQQANRPMMEVFTASAGELRERLSSERLTSLSTRLKQHVQVDNVQLAFTRSPTNVMFQDSNMEFIRNNINKGIAVSFVAKQLKLDMADLLVAGNAINDINMLDLPVGTSVLIGPKASREAILAYLSSPESIVTLDSPQALGKYLSKHF